jgi:uncharacterized protein (UPF0276 family)
LTGVGLKTPHYAHLLEKRPGVAWLEVHSENYFGNGGTLLHQLEQIRHHYPISLHGVSLSLGSADELNWHHLNKLRDLIDRINPCLISEHLSWSSIDGHYLHDLLPLPFNDETALHVIARVGKVQDYLGKQILIENISSYIEFEMSTMSEPDFLKEIAIKSGCGILLDINNIYVNAMNFGTDPKAYLSGVPKDLVQEIHLAGFTKTTIDQKDVLIDTHSHPVADEVWELYRYAIQTLGLKPTIIEWDDDIPPFDVLFEEAVHAEQIMRATYATTKPPERVG